jgi:hypothetical protein
MALKRCLGKATVAIVPKEKAAHANVRRQTHITLAKMFSCFSFSDKKLAGC